VELAKIADFDSALLSYMAAEHKDFMDALAVSGEYSDEVIKTFTDAIDKFKSTQTW
jgi:F-type H+-transporting ATPase subunit alpha